MTETVQLHTDKYRDNVQQRNMTDRKEISTSENTTLAFLHQETKRNCIVVPKNAALVIHNPILLADQLSH